MIGQATTSLLDAIFEYGPLIYAAIIVPLLAAMIVGCVIEIVRDHRSES